MPQITLTRVTKNHVKDFKEIEKTLLGLGARFIETKKQADYFFKLPNDKKDYRLKLRYENGKPKIIYYYNSKSDQSKPISPITYKVADEKIKDMLQTFLGIRVVVDKTRKVYKLEQYVFNLDKVKGVGTIFEIEEFSEKQDKKQTIFLLKKLKPFLGKQIKGSNENLVNNKICK